MTESKTLPLRSQVPIDETWDLESIFQTPEDWEAAGEELTGYIPRLSLHNNVSSCISGKKFYGHRPIL